MATYSVSIGDKVDVLRQIRKKNDEEKVKTLGSKVIDVMDEVTLKLIMPMDKTVTIPLEVDEECLMYFYTVYGVLQARTVVKDRFFEGSLAVIVIELITELEKIQRRQYYRLQCSIATKLHVLTAEENKELKNFEGTGKLIKEHKSKYINLVAENTLLWEDCIIIDLSGGGVKYISDKERKQEELIIIELDLTIGKTNYKYHILMSIISCERKSVESNKYEVRGVFLGISDSYRDTIVRFIFEEERKNRSKGNV